MSAFSQSVRIDERVLKCARDAEREKAYHTKTLAIAAAKTFVDAMPLDQHIVVHRSRDEQFDYIHRDLVIREIWSMDPVQYRNVEMMLPSARYPEKVLAPLRWAGRQVRQGLAPATAGLAETWAAAQDDVRSLSAPPRDDAELCRLKREARLRGEHIAG